MYLADIARRVILVVLFDNRTTLGLVKLRVRGTVRRAARRSSRRCSRGTAARRRRSEQGFLGEAEDEIDKLFGE